MKEYLKNALPYLAAILILSAIGLGIEWYRRRGLQRWAQEQGGTFEPGSLLEGTKIPEAAPFDANLGDGSVTYANVSRIPKPEAGYILGQYEHRYQNTKSERKTFSCVVCFISLPGPRFPQANVAPVVRGTALAPLLGAPAAPAPVPVPGAVPGFADQIQATPMPGAPELKPEALSSLLTKEVQELLLEKRDLISGFQVRGSVVRLQAVSRQTGYPHQEVFEVARRLAAIWTSKRP